MQPGSTLLLSLPCWCMPEKRDQCRAWKSHTQLKVRGNHVEFVLSERVLKTWPWRKELRHSQSRVLRSWWIQSRDSHCMPQLGLAWWRARAWTALGVASYFLTTVDLLQGIRRLLFLRPQPLAFRRPFFFYFVPLLFPSVPSSSLFRRNLVRFH